MVGHREGVGTTDGLGRGSFWVLLLSLTVFLYHKSLYERELARWKGAVLAPLPKPFHRRVEDLVCVSRDGVFLPLRSECLNELVEP